LIGDAFQSVCPSAGLGLDKILTDVDVLSMCVPRWLATPGMGVDKLADFYNHPRKLAADSRGLQRAYKHRCATIDPSLRWQIHCFLLHLKWQFLGSIESLHRSSRRKQEKFCAQFCVQYTQIVQHLATVDPIYVLDLPLIERERKRRRAVSASDETRSEAGSPDIPVDAQYIHAFSGVLPRADMGLRIRTKQIFPRKRTNRITYAA
jgi:hypothetical protein